MRTPEIIADLQNQLQHELLENILMNETTVLLESETLLFYQTHLSSQ